MNNSYEIKQELPAGRNDDCDDVLTSSSRAGQEPPRGGHVNSLAFTVWRTDTKFRTADRRGFAQTKLLGAVVGCVGGIVAALFGSVFTAVSWFVADESVRQWLSTAGSTLLLMTIPLIIFGGYCLDWTEKDNPQRYSKVARYEDEDDDQ